MHTSKSIAHQKYNTLKIDKSTKIWTRSLYCDNYYGGIEVKWINI